MVYLAMRMYLPRMLVRMRKRLGNVCGEVEGAGIRPSPRWIRVHFS